MQRQGSLYFIVIGVFLLMISGGFLSEGLSRVGMDNAVVSQRMAEGFEDFWLPSLSSPGHPDRMNYLPLGYWIESQWYNLFGSNSFMAEKVYSVLTYIIIAALMIWIWYLMGMPKRTGWLPLVCLITIPIVSWSATNNLLESTMTMFILLSVAFLLMAERAATIRMLRIAVSKPASIYTIGRVGWVLLAALAMELAFMVKGFSGLFPIFFPFIYWLLVRRVRVVFPILSTVLVLLVWIVTLFVAFLLSPDIYNHLYNYIHGQMIGGLLHVQTVASRFYIVYVLVVQMIVPLMILVIISLMRIRRNPFYRFIFYWRNDKLTEIQKGQSKTGWAMFVLGLSGVLPIMLGLKQQEFYIVPTLPFFALSMGCLLYYLLEDWLQNINKVANGVLIALALLLFGSGLIMNVSSLHKINSNEALLSDMKMILPQLRQGETISVSEEVMQNTEAAEYFYRYKQVLFDSLPGQNHYLSMYAPAELEMYEDLHLPTQTYKMYEIITKE